MERTGGKDVVMGMPGLAEEKLLAIVHELQPYCGNVYVVPQLWGLPMMNLQVDGFLRERVMMLKLTNNLAKPWNTWFKRGADLLLGAVLTLLALPLFLILTALIKIDSEGPALFVQERLGYRGRNFRCLKFPTFHVNSATNLPEYFHGHPQAAEEWRRYAKLRPFDLSDPGLRHFLRHLSLTY